MKIQEINNLEVINLEKVFKGFIKRHGLDDSNEREYLIDKYWSEFILKLVDHCDIEEYEIDDDSLEE